MRKILCTFAILFISITLFSFKPNNLKKPTFCELTAEFSTGEIAGKFTRVQYYSTSSDKSTWERYKETWDLTGSDAQTTEAENILNNY